MKTKLSEVYSKYVGRFGKALLDNEIRQITQKSLTRRSNKNKLLLEYGLEDRAFIIDNIISKKMYDETEFGIIRINNHDLQIILLCLRFNDIFKHKIYKRILKERVWQNYNRKIIDFINKKSEIFNNKKLIIKCINCGRTKKEKLTICSMCKSKRRLSISTNNIFVHSAYLKNFYGFAIAASYLKCIDSNIHFLNKKLSNKQFRHSRNFEYVYRVLRLKEEGVSYSEIAKDIWGGSLQADKWKVASYIFNRYTKIISS